MSFPNKDNAINSNFILVFPTPLHLHSSPMDSVPAIDYVPTLHERTPQCLLGTVWRTEMEPFLCLAFLSAALLPGITKDGRVL